MEKDDGPEPMRSPLGDEALLDEARRAQRQLEADLDAMTRLHGLASRFLPERGALEPVLIEIVDAAIAIAAADFGNMQILDPRTSDLTIVAQRGFAPWWVEFWNTASAGRGVCGTALELRQRVVVEDIEVSPIFAGTAALDVQRRAGVRAVQSTPLLTRSGKPIGVVSTHYRAPLRLEDRVLRMLDLLARQAADIIERAWTEEALSESEQRYATIFQMSPFAIALTKMPGTVTVDVNEAFLELFEHRREDVLGRTSVDLGISDPGAQAQVRAELLARGAVRDFECVRIARSGARRTLSLNVGWVQISGERYLLTEAIDITERKEGEAQQRRLAEQLAELNRDLERRVAERTDELRRARELAESASAAKSDFLSSMSHELRTPLNSILGFAQLLENDRKRPLDDRQLERLRHVMRGGEHLLRLIDDVLDLSRIEAGRLTISLEPVSIASVLEAVVDTLRPMADRARIAVAALEPGAAVPPVTADRTRLLQILMNFGSNAVKYGRPGGRVVFALEPRDPSCVRITVVDDGIGIPAEMQAKVFEPFQRAGQETGPIEGTGIGLTISKRLAELMHGRIGFSSEPARGSQFWIELPVHPQAAAELHQVGAPGAAWSPARGASGHKIVYVEDNPSNIAFMEDLLGDVPSVALLVARSAETGIELIRAQRPDVVIMDINLPGMSGLEAMRRLRAWPESRDIPVIGLSAAALPADTKRAAEAGFFRYLTKPVKVAELTNVLEELLGPSPPAGSEG
jgi:PAS domain S-box-containing protein